MALRQLILSKKIEALRAELKKNEERKAELEERRKAMDTREAEIEAAVAEVTEETPQEDRETVEKEADQFETDNKALCDDEAANENERAGIEENIAKLMDELDQLNERAKAQPAPERETEERKSEKKMETRKFFNLTMEQRDALFARDDVKGFAQNVREVAKQKRNISGKELLIPEVLLGILRDNTAANSKLMKHVNVHRISGTSRVVVAGNIPEAVWTDMCAAINELTIGFYGDEMDGFKEAGYIAICNAVLEDSDLNLVTEIISALGKALAIALDKAIVYGKGVKMPTGIVTRLAQTQQPSDYSAKARPWKNLSTTHLKSITGKNGIELFQALALAMSVTDNDYTSGGRFWVMNESTRTKLMVEAMNISAAGAIVTGMQNTMPVIGGAIETLGFIPDGVVIGGYGEHYFLAERAGAQIGYSEHVRYLEDQTVFKGTARYDGKPIIAESFVGIGIDVDAPAADDVTFASDLANAG